MSNKPESERIRCGWCDKEVEDENEVIRAESNDYCSKDCLEEAIDELMAPNFKCGRAFKCARERF